MKEHVAFIKHYLRNPAQVGAVTALNKSVAEKLIKYFLKRDINTPCRILEVGAGTGSITSQVIPYLKEHDSFDVVEIDQDCCKLLQKKLSAHANVAVHCASILNWQTANHYDFIVSTLPFNSLDVHFVKQVMERYSDLSVPNGICSYVEYAGLHKLSLLFSKRDEKEHIKSRRQALQHVQMRHLFDKEYVLNHLPPVHIYYLKMAPTD